jgi:trimethylamine:corrinoid methyltransferase-like protein
MEAQAVELLITLVLIGMVIYLLPYIIAGAMLLIGLTGGLLALIYVGVRSLFTR